MVNVFYFLLTLAFVEGVLKPLIVWITQREIRRFLPLLLDRFDILLPAWIDLPAKEVREQAINEIYSVGAQLGIEVTPQKAEKMLGIADGVFSFLTYSKKREQS